MHAQMGTLLLGQGERGRNRNGRAAHEKSMGTATHPFMENTKQCAHSDALIHKANLPQVLGQAHSHQQQQVGVPQFAVKEKKFQMRKREEGHDQT